MSNFKKYIIRTQGILDILAHLFDQYTIIVTTFGIVTIDSLLFVEYVKLYKTLRPGNKCIERSEQVTEFFSFRSYEQ